MRLIVGLGNPGNKYKNNRHNLGFLLADRFASSKDINFKSRKKYDFCKLQDIVLIKPKTYMNRSGAAVTSVLTENRLEDILVIVDDIYLPVGEIRLRRNGGFGGHNGLKSIGEALGTDNFKRMRIGVGSPDKEELSDFVLSDFSSAENQKMQIVMQFAEDLLKEYVEYDFDQMVALYSKLKKSYSEKIQDSQDQ
ncbi:MAG: aminoacyl-tRNA hydrolase [Candidatus Cloacimonetes bacterium]|nr:aminoacyl-tRNA hydrolase [Candidatus Cloacimonadota bacterium]MCF7813250.1 aminoacyl-tRNA hydrolase [Candidatus Cloacimonadota bacterium]MCF7867449.1 aminoacyl-tRNA hydrolase [Candidatus Cloacimonadota bacterium]MCF7882919.1 aminoacyl-tRNA hydrolase [Candidatus Cloacimonadota bacterium]